MNLYLVRHGEAMEKEQDPARPLTAQGRRDVESVAGLVKRAGIEVYQIRHSGKRRAEETAEILGRALEPEGGMVAVQGLAPNDDVQGAAKLLEGENQPLMYVGHLPFLERLVGLLVTGKPDQSVVRLEKGSMVCLERDAVSGGWAVAWAVTPALAGERRAGAEAQPDRMRREM
jgi:phosphohistidine phosphatase